MLNFTLFKRAGNIKLAPMLIAQLASQLEKLALEPYQDEIVHHLMQGRTISEVAAITGEPLESVLFSTIYALSQVSPPEPPDAPQTVGSRCGPPRAPLSAAAELVFSSEESVSAVASAQQPQAPSPSRIR